MNKRPELKFPLPEKEPLCRVGVVLHEDNKKKMDIVVPEGEFELTSPDNSARLTCDEPRSLSITVDDDTVVCTSRDEGELLRSPEMIRITRKGRERPLSRQTGIKMEGCVAGRGFHWQKEVDMYFPFSMEFHHRGDLLIAVNEIPLEAYLACVVTSEMSAECPPAFIKAQATAARSWMWVNLRDKHHNEPFTICNDDCCQRYQGATYLSPEVADRVKECAGMFLVARSGNVCDGYYSKCCGGIIERGSNVFGDTAEGLSESTDAPEGSITEQCNPVTDDTIREWVSGEWVKDSDSFCSPNVCSERELPKYLGAVDESGNYYRWSVVYSHDELLNFLKTKAGIPDMAEFIDFRPGFRGNSGRLHELTVVYRDTGGRQEQSTIQTEYNIRDALHEKFLFSSAFVWDYERDKEGKISAIHLHGAGWGHGTGLCQMGALGMALSDYAYEDILTHYYDKTSLKKAY